MEIKDEIIYNVDCDDVENDIVYTSEVTEDNLSPTFKKVQKKLRDLCFSDRNALLRFVFYNKNKNE